MMVSIVSEDVYFAHFPKARNAYGSREFVRVTAANAQAVRFFVGFDEGMHPRFGIVIGYKDGIWHAPYSAPFTEVAYSKPQHLERIYDFISELTTFIGAPLHISLPPDFYDPEMLPKITGVFANFATRRVMDFDFYYPLDRIDSFEESLDHAARKNLNRAKASDFVFTPTDDIDRAYGVIKANRDSHRYPLAMNLDQVKATAAAIGVDFFVMSRGSEDVAAAMVNHVTDDIVQVVYWGDAPGYTDLRPMNLFPMLLFRHYRDAGMKIVDVGPSSTAGIPNSGLCRFKESIGCLTALKPSFEFS